jgi:Flp pilus assembly protein TadG
MSRQGDDRGNAAVEAAIGTAVLLMVGFAALWFGNVFVRYHQADEAVHGGVRYAARAYYAPDSGNHRFRDANEIRRFVEHSASHLDLSDGDIQILCGTTPAAMTDCSGDVQSRTAHPAGTYIEVRIDRKYTDAITNLGRSINGLFQSINVNGPLPEQIEVKEASIAIVE